MAFKWEAPWGWAVGRLGPPSKAHANECNFSALYEDGWREQHTLLIGAYGLGDEPGSWVLLESTTRPEILEYANGKYKVATSDGERWFRAAQLVHHTAADLLAARRKAKEAAEAAEAAEAERELATPHAVGARVYAMGHAGGGGGEWFEAEVVGHRDAYPPIAVKYLANLAGDKSALALPSPSTAFVPASKVQIEMPSAAPA